MQPARKIPVAAIGTPHQEAASEFSLSDYRSGQRYQDGVNHRSALLSTSKDVRWIIDYKSSQLPTAANEDAFRQEQTEKYAPQLARYAALYRAMESREIRTALFFTALPAFHEVSLTGYSASPETAVGSPSQDTLF